MRNLLNVFQLVSFLRKNMTSKSHIIASSRSVTAAVDISNAFDLYKLHQSGISSNLLNWVKNNCSDGQKLLCQAVI